MSERPTAERLAEIERRASGPVAYVTQDRQAMRDLLAEIDALRALLLAAGRAAGATLSDEASAILDHVPEEVMRALDLARQEARAQSDVCKRELWAEKARADRAEKERDVARTQLAALREAAACARANPRPEHVAALDAAIYDTSAAAAEYRARVRREALEEAERECAGAEYAEQCEARIRALATKERP